MINIGELMGKTVIGAAGNYIGEVYNLDIEPNMWEVAYLHIMWQSK